MRSRGILVFAAFWLTACAGRFEAHGTIEHPAELPVRAFPPVVFVSAADPDSTAVATQVTEHVGRGGTPARLTNGEVTGAGIRVDLAVRFAPRAETRWASRPENVCGPYGCYVRQVTYPYDVLTLRGEVAVRVADPATAAVLAERSLTAEEIGTDSPARRAAIRHRLVAMVVAWFEPRQERVTVSMPRVSGEGYAHVVRLCHEGKWDEALDSLRRLRGEPSFAAMSTEDRAGLLVALAHAIRFSSTARIAPEVTLTEAIAVVDEANGLFRSDSGAALRAALELQLDEARVIAVQRGSGGGPTGAALIVPESYR